MCVYVYVPVPDDPAEPRVVYAAHSLAQCPLPPQLWQRSVDREGAEGLYRKEKEGAIELSAADCSCCSLRRSSA